MASPRTPSKNEGIDRIIDALNARWSLGLPVRQGLVSPSKSGANDTDSKILTKIRFLFFKDQSLLEMAIERFEYQAPQIFSAWVLKPQADQDVVPHRPNNSLLRQMRDSRPLQMDETSLSGLKKFLVMILDETTKSVSMPDARRDALPEGDPVFATHKPPATITRQSGQLATTSGLQVSSLSLEHSSKPLERKDLSSRHQPPAQSPDFSIVGLEDFEIAECPHEQTTQGSISYSTERYHMPLPAQESKRRNSSVVFTSNVDSIKLPQADKTKGKKRISTEGEITWPLRKTSRTEAFTVHHHEPTLISRESSDSSLATTVVTPLLTPNPSSGPATANTSFESNHAAKDNPTRKDQAPTDRADKTLLEAQPIIESLSNLSIRSPGTSGKALFDVIRYINQHLMAQSPFMGDPLQAGKFSFRIRWEVARVAAHTGVSESHFFGELANRGQFDEPDYETVMLTMGSCLQAGKKLPERSNEAAWDRAFGMFDNVGLSVELVFSTASFQPLLALKPSPLKPEPSCRLTRRFGSSRLLIVRIPSIESGTLPAILQNHAAHVKHLVVQWLTQEKHHFLGRTWVAFFIRPQDRRTERRTKSPQADFPAHRLYFFALDEAGSFEGQGAQIRSTRDLLDRTIAPALNMHQRATKLFARLQLVLSSTQATLTFAPSQILRRDAAYADSPSVWRLDLPRSEAKKANPILRLQKAGGVNVMNDGCARLSQKAARIIARSLGLSYTPCVFQGRIAGAKGLWMVDAIGESLSGCGSVVDPDVWIELTDDQVKFEIELVEAGEQDTPSDASTRTFDVLTHVQPLKPAYLNYQFLSVLLSGGVPFEVLQQFIVGSITTAADEIAAAARDPCKLARFLQTSSPVRSQRLAAGGIEWVGGLPYGRVDRMLWLLQSGFEPVENRFLGDLCREEIKHHQTRVVEKMNIEVARSTVAFIIADPLDVLAEDECFLCFSNPFLDPSTGAQVLLHDTDVLLARSPAVSPTDIQKRRAVFKPELASCYRDVLIFSSRGESSLASMLSGGDYDGDKCWICWDGALVDSFTNYEGNYRAKDKAYFGIKENETTLAEIRDTTADFVPAFLQLAIEFNLQTAMVSRVSTYHEAFVYGETIRHGARGMACEKAMDLAALFSYIIDGAKAGLGFGPEEWTSFLHRAGLPRSLQPPAYKREDGRVEERRHPIDALVHEARRLLDGLLTDFAKRINSGDARAYDSDLTAIVRAEHEHARREPSLSSMLGDLNEQLQRLHADWARTMAGTIERDESKEQFRAIACTFRARFLRIRPHPGSTSEVVRRWEEECESDCALATRGSWLRLKASALFALTYGRGHAVWWICGRELGQIKAEARDGSVPVVRSIHEVMKIDVKLVSDMELSERPLYDGSNEVFELDREFSDDEQDAAEWTTAFESFAEERLGADSGDELLDMQ